MNSKLQNILTAVKLLQGLGVELLGEKDITVSESAYAAMFGSYHGRTKADEGRWYIYRCRRFLDRHNHRQARTIRRTGGTIP